MQYKKTTINDLSLWNISQEEFQKILVNWINNRENNKPKFITYLNAHCFNVSETDKEYHAILKKSDLLYADGQSVVWASGLFGNKLSERVNAGDFILNFFHICSEKKIKIYLLGGKEEIINSAVNNFKNIIKDLPLTGFRNGFFKKEENETIINNINNADPDILIIGMGVPCQEKWLAENIDKINVKVAWCVGALFEYFSGYRKRAPVWMRKIGLEWLFRLALEPSRLWKRYLVGNLLFVMRVFKWAMKKKN